MSSSITVYRESFGDFNHHLEAAGVATKKPFGYSAFSDLLGYPERFAHFYHENMIYYNADNLQGIGHFPALEDPKVFSQEVLKFWAALKTHLKKFDHINKQQQEL
jgi:pimeloyl-ACP methyl ester carboxylesterase